MSLTVGSRVGSYEILSVLGAGGMGEVYRARDTKLNRDVALKILPEAFAFDGDRIARFRREAQVLAALNHPNIAAIYGFEDSGSTHALVLELVEGPTLADRIAKGPIPLDETLPIAKQIAEALEAAHEQGIVHRDLKPANIKVRDDGKVKVLDFGLAKALEPSSGPGVNLANSPTIISPAMMTGVGMILGTAGYMSPEQAKGRPADKRSDIWAFGCVVYEMVTGKRAFDGEDVTDTIAAVVRAEPDWRALPGNASEELRLLLRRCLEKDQRARVSDMAIARFLLNERINAVGDSGAAAGRKTPPAKRLATTTLITSAGVLVTALIAAVPVWWALNHRGDSPRVTRFVINLPSIAGLASPDRHIALSPDGTLLVYRNTSFSERQVGQVYLRQLDHLDGRPLTGVTGPWPFISPDSRWIGFFSQSTGELRKISVNGGPPVVLCRYVGNPRGASWGTDGNIVFATSDTSTGLMVVPEGGGEPKTLTKPDATRGEADHVFPSLLPGDRAVLFTITTKEQPVENAQVAVLDVKTGKYKTIVSGGTQAEYTKTGHLVYAAAGSLRSVTFDLGRLEVTSDPTSVVDQVATFGTGAADFSISRDGTLVYVPRSGGVSTGATRSLVWVTRQGIEEPLGAPVRGYTAPRLSPDGTRIALDIRDAGKGGIWIWDLVRQTLTPLAVDNQGQSTFPSWTPDGKKIIFSSSRGGAESNLYWQPADGTGTAERLTTSANRQFASFSVSPDGTKVPFVEINKGNDLQVLILDGRPHVEPLIQTSANEINAEIAPNGRFLAYQSDESGVNDIYVRPFPNVNAGRWQVSTSGGTKPAWARNGRELFYLDRDNAMTSVPVQMTDSAFNAGKPTKLFENPYFGANNVRTYDVSSDGQRFLMIKFGERTADSSAGIVVVLNWTEELKQRLPTK
jgi:serine/threonine-protein kinase